MMTSEPSTSANHPLSGGGPRPFKLYERFSSYEHFQNRLAEHKVATQTDYWVRDCRTLQKAIRITPRALSAKEELKYYNMKLTCIYGGQVFKSRSTNKRQFTGTFKQGCPAKIVVRLTKDSESLEIKDIVNNHNHICDLSNLRAKHSAVAKTKKIEREGFQHMKKNIIHEGYVYNLANTSTNRKAGSICNKKLYLICVKRKCPGRASKFIGEDGITQTKPHTHEPDVCALQRLQFHDLLQERAKKEATPLEQILEEESLKFPEVAEDSSFDKIKKKLAYLRLKTVPGNPRNLAELGYLLVSEDWYQRFGCNLENPPRDLFIGAVRGNGKETVVVFASLYMCDITNQPIPELHIDASYRNLPDSPLNMEYLLSIHLMHESYSFAAVYALMSSRSLGAYLAVLKFVRDEVLSQCSPSKVFSSFDAEMQIACRDVFPTAEIEGTTFHFAKDIWDRSQTLHLLDLPDKDNVLSMIKSCMVLPLLPASLMEAGLNAIAANVVRSNISSTPFAELIQHIRYSWLDAVGASEISAHDHHRRSNQNIQNFHQELNSLLANKPLTPWTLIGVLQEIEESHRQDHLHLLVGEPLHPVRQALLSMEDPKVVEATQMLADNKFGMLEFLVAVSSTVENMTIQSQTPQAITSFVETMEGLSESDS